MSKNVEKSFSTRRKGLTGDETSFLIGLVMFVIVVAVFALFIGVSSKVQEEQAFIESFRELAYTMDYVCATGTSATAEARLPQKVSVGKHYISIYHDPEYLIYYERFPAYEDWSWSALKQLTPLGYFSNEFVSKSLPIITASDIDGLNDMLTYASDGRIISGITSTYYGGSSSPYVSISEALRYTPLAIGEKARVALQYVVGARQAHIEGRNLDSFGSDALEAMIKIDWGDDSLQHIIPENDRDSDKAEYVLRFDTIRDKAFAYISQLQDGLTKISNDYSSRNEIDKPKLEKILYNSEMAVGDTYQLKDVKAMIEEMDMQDDSSMSLYYNTICDILLYEEEGGGDVTGKNVKAFYAALSSVYRKMDFTIIQRSLLVSDLEDQGFWEGSTYSFEKQFPNSEKAKLKYYFCGKSTLCAKTPNYILAQELKSCEDRYDFVALEKNTPLFDLLGILTPSSELLENVKDISGQKRVRFYLASPCGVEVKVSTGTCDCSDDKENIYELRYSETSEGKYTFKMMPEGSVPICEEPGLSGSGKDCLIVSMEKRLVGYGSKSEPNPETDYINYCYQDTSLIPGFIKEVSMGAFILVDYGATVMGISESIKGNIISDVFSDLGRSSYSEKNLWPGLARQNQKAW